MFALEILGLTPYLSPSDRAGSRGQPWSEDEVLLAVEDYFEMLHAETVDRPYAKADHWRALLKELDGRTKGSIERKHMNISAVLKELGYPYIAGYKPLGNYQQLLRQAVEAKVKRCPWLRRADSSTK